MFITSPFRMLPDFWTSDLVFRRMVVQWHRMAFLNKIYSPRGVDFCPPISKSSVETPFLISFLGFTYIELQVYIRLPKSECRFYLGGMPLSRVLAFTQYERSGRFRRILYYIISYVFISYKYWVKWQWQWQCFQRNSPCLACVYQVNLCQ